MNRLPRCRATQRRPAILRAAALGLGLAAAAAPAAADDVTDTIEAALAAYGQGDLKDALEELAYARQLISEMQTADLAAFLPEAPDGWSREIDTEMAAALSMMGGGFGAEATYAGGGQRFTVTLMADNPMVAGFAGMLGNAALLGGAKRVRIGGERFLDQDGELVALIDNRILVQASGAPLEAMVPVLEAMDFEALARFGN
jgi:hypothetical protein